MSAIEMWRGFFAHAEVVSPVDGVLLRSMTGHADSDDVGRSSPNRESVPPFLVWASSKGACWLGIQGLRRECPLGVDVTELVDRARRSREEAQNRRAKHEVHRLVLH
jgi:hypothetical protein